MWVLHVHDNFSLNFEYIYFIWVSVVFINIYKSYIENLPKYILLLIHWIPAHLSSKNPIDLSHYALNVYILLFIHWIKDSYHKRVKHFLNGLIHSYNLWQLLQNWHFFRKTSNVAEAFSHACIQLKFAFSRSLKCQKPEVTFSYVRCFTDICGL